MGVYISNIDNKPKFHFMTYCDATTIPVYVNDVITITFKDYWFSSFEEAGASIETDCSYTEFISEDGRPIIEFLLTNSNHTITFYDMLSDESDNGLFSMPRATEYKKEVNENV